MNDANLLPKTRSQLQNGQGEGIPHSDGTLVTADIAIPILSTAYQNPETVSVIFQLMRGEVRNN